MASYSGGSPLTGSSGWDGSHDDDDDNPLYGSSGGGSSDPSPDYIDPDSLDSEDRTVSYGGSDYTYDYGGDYTPSDERVSDPSPDYTVPEPEPEPDTSVSDALDSDGDVSRDDIESDERVSISSSGHVVSTASAPKRVLEAAQRVADSFRESAENDRTDPSPDFSVPEEDSGPAWEAPEGWGENDYGVEQVDEQPNQTETSDMTEINPAWEITEDPSPDYIDPSSDDPEDRTTTWGDSSYLHLMDGEEPSDILGDDWQQDMEDMNPTQSTNGAALADAFEALNARLAALENGGSGSSGLPRLGVVAAIVGGIALVAGAVFD